MKDSVSGFPEGLSDAEFRKYLLKKYEAESSSLVFHNYSKKTASFVELLCPFMLLYEQLNKTHDYFTLVEFSNNYQHHIVHSRYSEMEQLGEQPLHKHEFYEITFVISGVLHMQIEQDFYYLSPGECCLCNQNVRHSEIHDSDCEFLLIMLQEDFVDRLLSDDYLGTEEYLSHHAHPVISCLKHCSDITDPLSQKKYLTLKPKTNLYDANIELINTMVNCWNHPAPGSNYVFFSNLCRFLGNIDNSNNYDIETYLTENDKWEDLFIKASLLIEESHGTIRRSELEKAVGYTGDYLTRIIRHFTGWNFVEYCQYFSIKEAERLLRETTLTVNEISLFLGYNNRTHFNNLFKRDYGVSPKIYRQKCNSFFSQDPQ